MTDIAEIIFEHIYKLHGMPNQIISDSDSLFTSNFWKHLHSLTGVSLHRLSAYTGGIERFSASRNFSKISQVGHFHLGFSAGKNDNEITHSHRVLLDILDTVLENTNETL